MVPFIARHSTARPHRRFTLATVGAAALLFVVQFVLGTPLLGFVGLLAVVAAAARLPAAARLRGGLLGLAGATAAGAAVPALVAEYEAGARALDGFATTGVTLALSLSVLWVVVELADRTLPAE